MKQREHNGEHNGNYKVGKEPDREMAPGESAPWGAEEEPSAESTGKQQPRRWWPEPLQGPGPAPAHDLLVLELPLCHVL